MKDTQYIAEEELVERAVSILLKELGPLETNRFINLPKEKRMDSIKRHREWQKTLDKDVFLDEIFGQSSSIKP